MGTINMPMQPFALVVANDFMTARNVTQKCNKIKHFKKNYCLRSAKLLDPECWIRRKPDNKHTLGSMNEQNIPNKPSHHVEYHFKIKLLPVGKHQWFVHRNEV